MQFKNDCRDVEHRYLYPRGARVLPGQTRSDRAVAVHVFSRAATIAPHCGSGLGSRPPPVDPVAHVQ